MSSQIAEDQQVKDFLYGTFHYDQVVEATKELIQIITDDEETTQPISAIHSHYNEKDHTWTVWAAMAPNGKPFKYAMYIAENGWIIADGY